MAKHLITKETAKELGRRGGEALKGGQGNNRLTVKEAKKWMIDEFMKERQEWYAALRALGLGHYREQTLPDGTTVVVYKKPPNVEAIKEMLNRVLGKVPLSLEVESNQPVSISQYALNIIAPMLDPNDPEDADVITGEIVGHAHDRAGTDSVPPKVLSLKEASAPVRDVLLSAHHQELSTPCSSGLDRPSHEPQG